jgi:hypothetical protein
MSKQPTLMDYLYGRSKHANDSVAALAGENRESANPGYGRTSPWCMA